MSYITLFVDCEHIQVEQVAYDGYFIRCYGCGRERMVREQAMQGWKMKCYTCGYSRRTGKSKPLAERNANTHSVSFPGHRVKVLWGSSLDAYAEKNADRVVRNPAWQAALDRGASSTPPPWIVETLPLDLSSPADM